jgi:arsenate reductase
MQKTYNVLILCTGNSARSIIGEALFNTMGAGRIKALSAGSRPTGRVNPFAIEVVSGLGYPVENLRSKSWDEFAASGAPALDFVITVCDNAAGEVCPFWPGQPITAHWGFPIPLPLKAPTTKSARPSPRLFARCEGESNFSSAFPSTPSTVSQSRKKFATSVRNPCSKGAAP